MEKNTVHIIGAGLAGSEAAWQLASRGIKVILHEMKPQKYSPAHKNPGCAELVCSNSLRSDDCEHNAVGLMHQEMRLAGSLIMQCADASKVPAGGALAVDRDAFSALVTEKLKSHPLIEFVHEEVTALPPADWGEVIVASGPLTSDSLIADILKHIGNGSLSFYDAIAPVIYKESIDFSKAWYQSRYDKGDKFDYIDCPLDKEQYYRFVEELKTAEQVSFHEWEKASFFEGCLPIEVMAARGEDTLLYGPMKPVGLTNPNAASKPYAVVQLRQDNKEDTLGNSSGSSVRFPAWKMPSLPAWEAFIRIRLSKVPSFWMAFCVSKPCRISVLPDRLPAAKAISKTPAPDICPVTSPLAGCRAKSLFCRREPRLSAPCWHI